MRSPTERPFGGAFVECRQGAVVDGLVRDVERIEPLGFPVFGRGCRPVDSMGRFEVVDFPTPVECGRV